MEFKEYLLGDISLFKYGTMPKKELISEKGFPIYTGYRYVGYYPTYNIEKESLIVIARGVGGTGDVKICPPKTHLTNLSIAFDIDKNIIEKKYLYYKFILSNLKYLDSGSAQSQITINDLKRINVKLPSLINQKAVANILSSLDDKIQLNHKINKNLEELAQTIYKRWFVDFEFPNEIGEPYMSSGGEMSDSELGFIPKGWKITNIGEVCKTVLGGTPSRKNEDYWNGSVNWINSGKVNELRVIMASEKVTVLGMENSSTKLMPSKTTIIAITGATLGAVSLLEIDTCANQSVIGIYQSEKLPYSYVYSTIKDKITDIIGRQTGGAQQHINKNDVNSFKILLPEFQIINKFHNTVEKFHDEIANRLFQNIKLSSIRDELLPKLMYGEIEVPIEE